MLQFLILLTIGLLWMDILPRLETKAKTASHYRGLAPQRFTGWAGSHANVTDGKSSGRTIMTTKDTFNRFGEISEFTSASEEHCRYKIQLYDVRGALVKGKGNSFHFNRILKNLTAGVPCDRNCTVEVVFGNEKNNFTGMDAVVFHIFMNSVPSHGLPAVMNPDQAWVFCSWESPRTSVFPGRKEPKLTGLTANAVWTYHRASEITTPYGFYKPGVPMTHEAKTSDEWVQGKTKVALWVASNCGVTSWPRLSFVRKLQRYIPLDIYGRCGNLTCRPRTSPKCTVDLVRKYKFYLALENSECEDYITEKAWEKPLMQGVVPIVYGARREDYENLLPPNSFIYVGDFKDMEKLADYLKMLDRHPDLYSKYFEWRYKGNVIYTGAMYKTFDPSRLCHLIPVIEKVRRGELQRKPVLSSDFFQTCRKEPFLGKGLRWDPW
ncbi:alpha-(1,3)-fucosyltransferase 5-like [Acanthaster planci]|uniref:Fucosyltransferase n=1 Tax=Acanthaster planci TaxID=133434 RepID=A0A8B7ZWF7_ACAPL|nr:alpha-(1,3)-fucosyltransferase 5-like [Acanthaster planci]